MNMRVVVVDDNSVNIALMTHLIRGLEGATAVTFTDSEAGLAWCLAEDPDLVIVDYMMPPPDGLVFIEALRASAAHRDTPLLMITANHDEQVRHQALGLGCNDFLTKPINRVEFLARARNMLALRRAQCHLRDRASWLAEEVDKATREIRQREYEAITLLSKAAEYRDPETGAHILRMANYSAMIARGLGLPTAEVDLLLKAAPMHDIGKVGIADHILLKPGRLSPDEMTIMRRHAQIGYDILKASDSPLMQAAALVAQTHHEKYDGTGYPHALVGEQIPLYGRIVAVADVFDALTSTRPYKVAWELEQAVAYVRTNRGEHFDPSCVDVFLDNLAEVERIKATYTDDGVSSL